MTDVFLPLTNIVQYSQSGGMNAEPQAVFPVGTDKATVVSDGSDSTGLNLVYEYADDTQQNFVQGTIDASALPVDAEIAAWRWRFRYQHSYADPVPSFTQLRVVEFVEFSGTSTQQLPAVAGFTWAETEVSSATALTTANLLSGVLVQLHRQNSMGDAQPIQVSEFGLLVTLAAPQMAFTGKLYWQANNDIIQSWDASTGALSTVTSEDAGIPASIVAASGDYRPSLGTLIGLGSGEILVNCLSGDGDLQQGFTMASDLSLDASVAWEHVHNGFWWNSGYVGYEEGSGVFDPVTGLNWLARTVSTSDKPYEWNGYDNDGNFVAGRGDTSLIPVFGDAYIGGNFREPIGASLLGRWLYRFLPYGDGLARYNLDTDVWEAILPEPNPNPSYPYVCKFLGTNEADGTYVTLHTTYNWRDNYDGKAGWLEVRDPNADPWINPVPNGISSSSYHLGPPLRAFDPTPPGGELNRVGTWGGRGDGHVRIVDGRAYYSYVPQPSWIYGDPIYSFYSMDLNDGSIEKVLDVPFHAYYEDGTQADTAPDWNGSYFNDNYSNPPMGLLVVPGSAPPMQGRPLRGGVRFLPFR